MEKGETTLRKKTISNLADHIFWLIVGLMPLILYALQFLAYELTAVSTDLPTFLQFMQNFGLSTTSVCYTVLQDLFGSEGILPLYASGDNAVVLFLSYFVTVEIVHLAVDFLLFIPRLSHKWLEKITCTE